MLGFRSCVPCIYFLYSLDGLNTIFEAQKQQYQNKFLSLSFFYFILNCSKGVNNFFFCFFFIRPTFSACLFIFLRFTIAI